MQRAHVGDVADVGVEEGEPAAGIDGLQDDPGAGPELAPGDVEQAHQVVRLQVFDHLGGEQPSQ